MYSIWFLLGIQALFAVILARPILSIGIDDYC
jgi:hypothetical protein